MSGWGWGQAWCSQSGCQAGSESCKDCVSGEWGEVVWGKGGDPSGSTFGDPQPASSSTPSTSAFLLPKAAPNGSSDIRFYLTVYATIAGVNSLCTLLRAVLFAAGTLRAAAILHRRLLCRVLMVRG